MVELADRNFGTISKRNFYIILMSTALLVRQLCWFVNHTNQYNCHKLTSKQFTRNSDAIKANGNESCPEDSFEKGVLYFAYHIDREKTLHIFNNVRESVHALRIHNPCLRIAVASNYIPEQLESWGIDDIVVINKEDVIEGPETMQGRQWWTRTLYLPKSPYKYTVQLDSDRTACGNIGQIFHHLDSYDFIGVSSGILPALDNGVMAWKKSTKFDQLIATWKGKLSEQGKVGDDQPSLAMALDILPDIKAGVMNPTFQVKYIPAVGETWSTAIAKRTLVLHGPAKIVAGNEKTCQVINEGPRWPRILLVDFGKETKVAYSQAECDRYLNEKCDFNELDWELDFNIMSRELYLQMYS